MSPSTLIISQDPVGLVRGRHGYMLFNQNDAYIGRSLKCYGEYSEEEVELLLEIVQPGDTVVEVGANLGAHTVPLATRVGIRGRVYAFEPQRLIFQTLCANIALNGLCNVHCQLAACGATPGEIVVPTLDFTRPANFGGVSLGLEHLGERVPVITVDSLELPSCALIKVDVEGMELQVLHGARETIRRCGPCLYVENDRDENSESLIEYILNLEYECYWHLPPLFNRKNYFQNAENVFANIHSVNMLCLPTGSTRLRHRNLQQVTGPRSSWRLSEKVASPSIETRSMPVLAHTAADMIELARRSAAEGNWREAHEICDSLPALEISHFGPLWQVAVLAISKNNFELAAKVLERLALLNPSEPAVHCNLGATYGHLGEHAKAADCFRHAIRILPDFPDAHFNYGNALREIGELREAAKSCQRGLALQPNSVTGHLLLANALDDLGKTLEARENYEKALRLSPGNASIHKNLGILLLRSGDFPNGWREYEWRFRADGVTSPEARFPQPYWDGTPLAGRTLLLYGEQGLGDQIQFVRFADAIEGNVVVQVDNRLTRILQSKKGTYTITGMSDACPPFDVHAPLMSLPRILKTTLETIPNGGPYLAAEPAKIDCWQDRMAHLPGFRVGIAWQGSKHHSRDRLRSLPLALLEPLARLPSIHLVNLQKGQGHEQISKCIWGSKIADFSEHMDPGTDAFVDTAAIIKNLDLVITIDSAIAHLAGALGHPTWLLLRPIADWRWLTNTEISPWYPSLRILRQPIMDDWSSLIPVIIARLEDHLSSVRLAKH